MPVRMLKVTADDHGIRVDNFIMKMCRGIPRSRVYKALRKGEVRVNKKRIKPVYKLQLNDVVRIPPIKVAEKEEFVPKKLDKVKQLEDAILFEDKYLMVINKPSGMAVHGGSGLSYGLIEALRVLRPEERSLELVHRLDRDTSGCLLISKRRSVLTDLHKQLREKTMEKNYWALVDGQWDSKTKNVTEGLRKNTLKSGERVVRVDNTEGKPSHTRFRVLERYAECSLVQASPVTGRTHQIRVHTQCKGHPIACDDKYGVAEFDQYVNKLTGLNRLFLHAHDLRFMHPKNETTMHVEAPLDNALQNCIKKLRADNEQV